MRGVLSMIAVCVLTPGVASAQAWIIVSECDSLSRMASLTMQMRQEGYPMQSMLDELYGRADQMTADSVVALDGLVREAYRVPRHHDPEQAMGAISHFAATVAVQCERLRAERPPESKPRE